MSLSIAIDFPAKEMRDYYAGLQSRLRDWRPAGPAIHEALLAGQRALVIASEGRLGPSLDSQTHSEHIWQTGPNTFDFGTSVPYAAAVEAMRKDEGLESILRVTDPMRDQIVGILAEWWIEGRR